MTWKPYQDLHSTTSQDPQRGALSLTILALVVVLAAWWLNHNAVEPRGDGPIGTSKAGY